MATRATAAADCVEALDSVFLKALAEPARIEIVRMLILHGRSDVGSIAEKVPQERSVVARHLQVLERARILRSSSESRHTFYEIDGEGVLVQLRALTALIEKLTPLCCPKK